MNNFALNFRAFLIKTMKYLVILTFIFFASTGKNQDLVINLLSLYQKKKMLLTEKNYSEAIVLIVINVIEIL